MIPARLTIAVLAPVLLALGCAALGWRFGPGFSSRDVGLFAASPVIELRADGAFLAWTYGDSAFFFQPGYRAIDGRLVFSLQGRAARATCAVGAARIALRAVGEEIEV